MVYGYETLQIDARSIQNHCRSLNKEFLEGTAKSRYQLRRLFLIYGAIERLVTTFSRLFLSLFLYPSVAKSIYNFGRLLYNSSVYINTDTGKLSFDEAFGF